MARRPKRGREDLAATWWAYAVQKFMDENGLSRGGFAVQIGKEPSIIRRWLYDGITPKPGALQRTIDVIERRWAAVGWFARHRPEAQQWALKRLKTVDPRSRAQFQAVIEHSPTAWVELDDLLRGTGVPVMPTYPVPYDTACELLAQAAAELARMPDGPRHEELEMEIAAWRLAYGCD